MDLLKYLHTHTDKWKEVRTQWMLPNKKENSDI